MAKKKKIKKVLSCLRCNFVLTSKTAKKGDICPWCEKGRLKIEIEK